MESDSDRDESVSRRSDGDDGGGGGGPALYGGGGDNEPAYGSYGSGGGGSTGGGGGGAAGRGPRGRARVMQLEDTRADRDVWGDEAAAAAGGEAADRVGFWRGGGGMMAQGGRKSYHAHTLSAPALGATMGMGGGGGGPGAGGAASASSALDAVAAVPPPDKSGLCTGKTSAACRGAASTQRPGRAWWWWGAKPCPSSLSPSVPACRPFTALIVPRSGWLYKRGNLNSSWKRRWFVLRYQTLKYYKKSGDTKAKGFISLSAALLTPGTSDKMRRLHGFEISSLKYTRVFVIHAESAQEMAEWIECLQANIRYVSQVIEREKKQQNVNGAPGGLGLGLGMGAGLGLGLDVHGAHALTGHPFSDTHLSTMQSKQLRTSPPDPHARTHARTRRHRLPATCGWLPLESSLFAHLYVPLAFRL